MADTTKIVALPLSRERQRLVEDALPLVRKLARAFARLYGYDRDELLGHGSLALTEAARRFDPAEEVPFAAFAYPRVRGEMLDRAGQARREERRFRVREPAQILGDLPSDADPHATEEQARSTVAQNAALLAASFALHEAASQASANPEEQLVAYESATTVSGGLQRAVASLEHDARRLVELHYFEGVPLKDVAARTGVPYRTTRRRHVSALESLAKRLAGRGDPPTPLASSGLG